MFHKYGKHDVQRAGNQSQDRGRGNSQQDGKSKCQTDKVARQHTWEQPFQTGAQGLMGKAGSTHIL